MTSKNQENRRGFRKLASFHIHPKFEATKGYLSIKPGNTLYKFCDGCADRLRGYNLELKRHCDRNHGKH